MATCVGLGEGAAIKGTASTLVMTTLYVGVVELGQKTAMMQELRSARVERRKDRRPMSPTVTSGAET